MRINKDKCLKDEPNYFRTIVSMTKEDKAFIIKHKLSLTKIVREVVAYLREEESRR